MLPSEVLPRFTRKCVPPIATLSPNQIVKPTGLLAETAVYLIRLPELRGFGSLGSRVLECYIPYWTKVQD
jgi:hypothetical protein